MHVGCYVDVESYGQASLTAPARIWERDDRPPVPACGLRSRPGPPALTGKPIVEVERLRQWKLHSDGDCRATGGGNQASASQALRETENPGVSPKHLTGK